MMTRRPSAMQRTAEQHPAGATPVPAGRTSIDTTPIRTTIDLDRTLYGDLSGWIAAEGARSRRRIKSADVHRALVSLLVEDSTVADLVRGRLSQ